MASYNDLDINQRINLKGLLADWAKYSVLDLQANVNKVVYGQRTSRSGVQRSALGTNYRFGRGRTTRTNALRRTWYQNVTGERVMIQFLLYGRFLDMGVGRGTTATDRTVNRQLRIGSPGRQRRPWYAKKKSHEIHRLRELMAQRYITVSADFIESALSLSLTRTV